ncbi:superoxide dismutase family protein [Pendulispora rubella]|uniref:Superoxide dismutase [Cu-Zn] n=1 Tax=Pendulispora rubella TaxID=2741070 RepID=A0ABZ2KWX7_9BACT
MASILACVGVSSLVLNACSSDDDSPVRYKAHADIRPTSDATQLQGTATFTEESGETTVVVNIQSALPPGTAGMRGLHIHQNNNCASTTGDAGAVPGGGAGGHWNPTDSAHGYPTNTGHHVGDLGNIEIKADGTGTLTYKSKEFRVQEGGMSVVGHAIVFHQQTDDGVSQPVGNAGARPGCGVIVKD